MSAREELKKRFAEDDIRRVKIGGFDIDGILRGKYLHLDKFWSLVDDGLGFCDVIFGWDSQDQLYDDSKVTGWHTGYPDVHAQLDPNSYRKIPWEPHTAAFLLDFDTPVSPRQVLRSVLDQLEAQGLTAKASFEFEFFVFKEDAQDLQERNFADPEPLSHGMFGYSWLRGAQSAAWVHDLLDQLDAYGVRVEGLHTETGPGVWEAALRYTDALEAADRAALFKTAVKEISHRHGLLPTFMAKPHAKMPGCSGHLHQSLWKDGKNVFFDGKDEHKMSTTCQHYLAGHLALMPELTAMVAPTINSYKRLTGGDWAPSTVTWGIENRTCSLRMIPGSEGSTRIENRMGGADLNPYLALAAQLAAGLYGIEHKLKLQPRMVGNAYASDAKRLPTTLEAAVDAFHTSDTVSQLLDPVFVDHYAMTRRWEIKQFAMAVTDWERNRYFEQT